MREEGDLTLEMGETSLSEEAVQDQSTALLLPGRFYLPLFQILI